MMQGGCSFFGSTGKEEKEGAGLLVGMKHTHNSLSLTHIHNPKHGIFLGRTFLHQRVMLSVSKLSFFKVDVG